MAHNTLTQDLADKLTKVTKDRADLEARERVLVRRARSEGASWAAIGAALGVTKQAAAKRFAAVDAEAWAELRTAMREERRQQLELPAETVAAVVEPAKQQLVHKSITSPSGDVLAANVLACQPGSRWDAEPSAWRWTKVTCPACLEQQQERTEAALRELGQA